MNHSISSYIDHTLLSATATPAAIQRLCSEAIQFRFAAVCLPPYFVSMARKRIKNNEVKIATVIGFPFGYNTIESKKAEVINAIGSGADELDMVINIAALKSNNYPYLEQEIQSCLQPIRLHRKKIKIIIESGVLTPKEIIACCYFYAKFKVDFIKTSTGFAAKGADVATIKLMRENLPEEIQIKASGGIRTFTFAMDLIEAGANRIGTSSGLDILEGASTSN